jgi:hemin uptake protein HemP
MQVQENTSRAIPTRRFPTIDSNNLFAISREIRINHEGEEYRLRITSNNKLILTK